MEASQEVPTCSPSSPSLSLSLSFPPSPTSSVPSPSSPKHVAPETIETVERLLYEEQVACIDIRDTGNAIAKLAKEGLTKGYGEDFVTQLNDKVEYLKSVIKSVEGMHSKKRELGEVIGDCIERPQSGFVLRPRRFKKKKIMWDAMKSKKGADDGERRVCQFCGTTRSAEWRRGPAGTKSLCNACGLHYSKTLKKEGMIAPLNDTPPKVMAVNNLLN